MYRGLWKVTKGKKIEVAMKVLKDEYRDKYYKVNLFTFYLILCLFYNLHFMF